MKYKYLSPLGENLRELPTPLPELFFDKRCMHTIGCELPNLLEDPQPVEVVKIKNAGVEVQTATTTFG